jgi:hypothetical protein
MATKRELQQSRDRVVEWFHHRRSLASLDGSVHTDGDTLCVGPYHVAFWHQSTVYLVPLSDPNALVKDIQAMVRLGSNSHSVAEVEE